MNFPSVGPIGADSGTDERRNGETHPSARLSGSRLLGIEGLRAIAASSIVVYHSWLYSSPTGRRVDLGHVGGFVLPYLPVGVTLFFTLSAFLLYRPVADAVLRNAPRQPLAKYLRNRALRILPAYWLILLILGVLLGASVIRLSPDQVELGRLGSHPSTLLLNLALLQNYFPRTVITGIPPTWSLAVEVVFYVTLPVLGWAAAVGARRAVTVRRRSLAALFPAGLLLAIGLSGKAAAEWLAPAAAGSSPGWNGDWHSVLVRSFWAQADLFSFGMVLAVVWVSVAAGNLRLPAWWRGPVAVALIAIACSTRFFGEAEVLGPSGWATLLALGCSLLLALVVLPDAGRRSSRLTKLLETRVMVAIGLASYSLFLWHEPLVRWLAAHGLTLGGRGGFLVNVLIVSSLSGVLAALSYHLVERPALVRKARPSREEIDTRSQLAAEATPRRGTAPG